MSKKPLRAELGDREAAFELGERCYEGRGVPQDYSMAAAWFRPLN